ncbi:MAG: beta-ketoacyl-[acyl-carrier-protein] synthase family protein [Acidobacteria bacterium]|nr:beta-ketoacyl-[acyl-carrier-protein] synthase family protein [Acidobacteriota bacterium]
MKIERQRVVITGVGAVTPVGSGRDAFWQAICEGRSGTRRLDHLPGGFPVETFRSQVVARVADDDLPERVGSEPEDRRLRLGRRALELVLEDVGLNEEERAETCLVLGNAVGAPSAAEALWLELERRGGDWRDLRAEELLRQLSFHSLTHELALEAGCLGQAVTLSTGCTAGLDAIGAAFELVQSGQATRVIAGSVEAPLTPVVFASFDLIGAISKRNDDAEHASRPWDEQRDGFVLAEGAALVLLEERQAALERGATIYAEICGFASLSNSYHMNKLPKSGEELSECIDQVLADARVAPEAIDHVNAHGSSTEQNDVCETNALKRSLGTRARQITVNSLKSMIGHALGASNAIEIAACALSLKHQHLFPTINFERPGDECDLDYVPNVGRDAEMRYLLKLSSGFSGIHSAMVLAAPEAS